MSPKSKDATLKPCPFCGEEVSTFNGMGGSLMVKQHDHSHHWINWQNAYCWIQLDSLLKQRDLLRGALEKIKGFEGGCTCEHDECVFRMAEIALQSCEGEF